MYSKKMLHEDHSCSPNLLSLDCATIQLTETSQRKPHEKQIAGRYKTLLG